MRLNDSHDQTVLHQAPLDVGGNGCQFLRAMPEEVEFASTTTRVCAFVDLPFSFIGDTALFPFQVGYWMFR